MYRYEYDTNKFVNREQEEGRYIFGSFTQTSSLKSIQHFNL